VGHEPGRAGRLGQGLDGIEVVDGGDALRPRVPLLGRLRRVSFDDKNKKVTQAMAKLLQRAGIDFAILGPSEMCTGDPARRSGNEYIFQMLAMQNIETLERHGREEDHHPVPALLQHAANEYPQLGGTTRSCTTASSSSG
jgi:hypothetical protein